MGQYRSGDVPFAITIVLTLIVLIIGVYVAFSTVLPNDDFGADPQGTARTTLEAFIANVERPCSQAGFSTPQTTTFRFSSTMTEVAIGGSGDVKATLKDGSNVFVTPKHCQLLVICHSSSGGRGCTGGGTMTLTNENNHAVEMTLHSDGSTVWIDPVDS